MDDRESLWAGDRSAPSPRARGDLWAWVYGPVLAGLALLAGGVLCAAGGGGGDVSVWADVSLIFLTLLAMAALLLGGVVLGLLV